MKDSTKENYRIEKNKDSLTLMTSSFEAEKGSVLHSEIYNREFTSTLASMAVAVVVYMMLVMIFEKQMISYISSAVVFIIGFVLFRTYVFKGRYLETILNSIAGTAEIALSGITRRKQEIFPMQKITDVSVESKKTSIENPDGVAFVEKISAQHGVSIPGFGEETTFYMLKLKLSDGTDRMIYADSNMENVKSVQGEIKEFLKV